MTDSVKPCWHCNGSNQCDCILCGKDGRAGASIVRKAGPCVACVGRLFVESHRDIIDRFDPRQRRLWRHKPAADGNPVIRIYLPLLPKNVAKLREAKGGD